MHLLALYPLTAMLTGYFAYGIYSIVVLPKSDDFDYNTQDFQERFLVRIKTFSESLNTLTEPPNPLPIII